jgi:hypothetical protein
MKEKNKKWQTELVDDSQRPIVAYDISELTIFDFYVRETLYFIYKYKDIYKVIIETGDNFIDSPKTLEIKLMTEKEIFEIYGIKL